MASIDDERARRERRRAVERSRRGHPVGRELPGAVPPPVITRLTEVVGSGDPVELLVELSALLAEVAQGEDDLDTRRLVGLVIDHESPETSLALTVLAHLLEDDVLRAGVRRELRLRVDEVPGWAQDLPTVVTAVSATPTGIRADLAVPDASGPLHVHARVDASGQVVDGALAPSGPLRSWPGCAPLCRWVVGVARRRQDL